MISQVLKCRVLPENLMLQVARYVIFVCAILIPGYGFIKMAPLHLTEAQWLLGLGIIVGLDLQCMILTALIDLRRRGVEP
jgi:hypothetical protein